jgi:beta-D-xylosidase 4
MQGYPEYASAAPFSLSGDGQPKLLHASSCLKHYFAYDGPEDTGNTTRFDFDAKVSEQDLADTYLPGFEAGARPDLGAATGVMCSCECNGHRLSLSLSRILRAIYV